MLVRGAATKAGRVGGGQPISHAPHQLISFLIAQSLEPRISPASIDRSIRSSTIHDSDTRKHVSKACNSQHRFKTNTSFGYHWR